MHFFSNLKGKDGAMFACHIPTGSQSLWAPGVVGVQVCLVTDGTPARSCPDRGAVAGEGTVVKGRLVQAVVGGAV